MEKLSFTGQPKTFEESIVLEHHKKKKMAKSFLANAGIFLGVFLLFAVVVIVTTDISLISFEDIAALALDFFVLLFCSYMMYINCADSGMRKGLTSSLYKTELDNFKALKEKIVGNKMQVYLSDFCRHYIAQELESTKMSVLAVVGYSYEQYQKEYQALDEETIEALQDLSKAQKKALIRANKIQPIELTPEMILKRGRGNNRRSPLGITPEMKKLINFVIKFVTNFFVAGVMSIIVLNMVMEPTWEIIASCMLQLIAVIMNGFTGYKFGYENIVFDTANYISDQSDLLNQAIQYLEMQNYDNKIN